MMLMDPQLSGLRWRRRYIGSGHSGEAVPEFGSTLAVLWRLQDGASAWG